MKTIASLVLASVLAAAALEAQTASVEADVVSRHVWRGTDYGESMALQPSVSFEAWGLEIGAWGSYAVASGSDANEIEVWLRYSYRSVTAGVTDYYFPAPGAVGLLDRKAHTPEAFVSLTGPETFPFVLFGGVLIDEYTPVYAEVSVPVADLRDVQVTAHAGAVSGESGFYGTDGLALVNVGVTATKSVDLTDSFKLPVSVACIVNPDQNGRGFLVLRLGLVR